MDDLTTVDAVKQYLGITVSTDDALLAVLVAAYSTWVRSYTSRDFTIESYDLYRSGRCQTSMQLPQWPIIAITSLLVDGRAIAAQANFGAYGYRFTDRAVTLDGGASFGLGTDNVHILFSAGYATIPADVANATTQLVALHYNMRDKLDWTSKTLASEVISVMTKAMPETVRLALDAYTNKVPL